jgi:beta-lactamase class A
MNSFFSKKFSLLQVTIVVLCIGTMTFGFTLFCLNKTEPNTVVPASSAETCGFEIKRMSGFKYVRPILWVDEPCESDRLAGLKVKVSELINKHKKAKDISDASVYLRIGGDWTGVNELVKYNPGSLFRLPVLITILKMNEQNPGFLNTKLTLTKAIASENSFAASKSLQVNQSYTIKELLEYMIKYDDDKATALLESVMKTETLKNLFETVGFTFPKTYSPQYDFSASDVTLFMSAIFNGGYLSIDDSEYAAEFLGACGFKNGLAKGIPLNNKMAHEFGESSAQNTKQLHETGVIYLEGKGYLITIMTKGKDIKKLSEFMGEMSKMVYNTIQNN